MLCGYESVINGVGTSQFCRPDIFDTEDWKNFEYYFDLVYHKVREMNMPSCIFSQQHFTDGRVC